MYKCNLCKYQTGSRKKIRQHVKNVHQRKGKEKFSMDRNAKSSISLAYHNTDYIRGVDQE